MAYELVAEVLDHAPCELTPTERLVLVVIAEYVLSDDYKRGIRRTSRPAADISRRAGLKKEGVKDALQRLAKRGLDVRVPISTGKDDRPVYAVPGKSCTYEVPEFPAPADCLCDTCKRLIPTLGLIHKAGARPPLEAPKGGPQPPLNDLKGGAQPRVGGGTAPPGGGTAPPGGATAPPNRVRVPGNPGPRARPRAPARPTPTPEDTETIIEEMTDAGFPVTTDQAYRIYTDITTRAATPPRHPLQYVLAAIRQEPHRYRPTPTPPTINTPRQPPLLGLITTERQKHLAANWRTADPDPIADTN
jgi:hypothetical protein